MIFLSVHFELELSKSWSMHQKHRCPPNNYVVESQYSLYKISPSKIWFLGPMVGVKISSVFFIVTFSIPESKTESYKYLLHLLLLKKNPD